MRGYLEALGAFAVLGALVSALCPRSMSTHIRALCALCAVCLVCLPAGRALGAFYTGDWQLPDYFWEQEQEQDTEPDYGQFSKQMLESVLKERLTAKFSISPDDVAVWSEWEDGTRVIRVTVVLSGRAIWQDPAPIRACVQELVGCECVVVLD